MKVLCVCKEGYVRSTCMKWAFGTDGHEALAVGCSNTSDATMIYLCAWADRIVLAEGEMRDYIPLTSQNKIIDANIGKDLWGFEYMEDALKVIRLALSSDLRRLREEEGR